MSSKIPPKNDYLPTKSNIVRLVEIFFLLNSAPILVFNLHYSFP